MPRKLLEIKPVDIAIKFEMACGLEKKNPKKALRLYQECILKGFNIATCAMNITTIYAAEKNIETSYPYALMAAGLAPQKPMAWFNLACVCEGRRGKEGAVEYYLKAIDLDPRYSDAHYNLAKLLKESRGSEVNNDVIFHLGAFLRYASADDPCRASATRLLNRLMSSPQPDGGTGEQPHLL